MEKEERLLKILVCDDDPQDRKLIRAYLGQVKNREIVMLEAGQTTEIQTALDKGRVDLVLMDIQMPEKSGMEWLKEITEKRTAPVVMLTGHGNEEVAVQSLQQGAVGYLPKSRMSAEKLTETIDGAVEAWRELTLRRANQEQLVRLANVDSPTGLLNRRAILYRLDEQMKHARRYEEKLSVLMLDIDHFKQVNDNHGHITGDDVLERVAMLLERLIRDTDTAGRYGGDEFMVVLPKTDLSSALVIAERVLNAISTTEMKDLRGNMFGITISGGLARYKPGDDMCSLISRADNALYLAKQNGRNRVETSESVTSGV